MDNPTTTATQVSSEQQRRNKKRKPPNYYQSAEYAALIKTTNSDNNSDTSLANNTTTDSSGVILDSHGPVVTPATITASGENIQSSSSTVIEPVNQEESPQSGEIIDAKLKEIKLSDETKEKESVSAGATVSAWGSTNNKSWSSLFPSQSNVSSSNKQPAVSSSSSSSKQVKPSTTTHLNGGGTATNSQQQQQLVSKQAESALLKSLGSVFKECALKHSAPALQPRGIRNKSNWCYVNATLQSLLACPPLYNLIKSVHTKIKSMTSSSSSAAAMQQVPVLFAMGRFVSEFKVMIRPPNTGESTSSSTVVVGAKNSVVSLNGKELVIGDSFDIDYFYDTLSTVVNNNSNSSVPLFAKSGRQEDAQEFLSFLLNRLHDEMIKCMENGLLPPPVVNNETTHVEGHVVNGSVMTSGEASQNDNKDDDSDEWKEVGKKNKAYVTRKAEFKKSPLSDIFCGQLRSALIQTGVKDKESVSLEPFFTLPLEIQSDTIRTVSQALEHFVQKEELFGFTHQETKKEIEAFKRISFEDLPPVLIIHLKCFVYDKHGGIQKLLKRVEFQIDLEISKELISAGQRSKIKESRRKYKLFAVEYHQGERASGGHYITDVYHPGIVSWVRFNDAHVQMVTNSQVLKPTSPEDRKQLVPYLLYYRRADLI